MSKKYKYFVSTSLSIEDKQKHINELKKNIHKVKAQEMYQKGFLMGIVFSTISVFIILGIVYLATHYEFIF
tara:strand:- start:39 stop:251 length:213 start_codon:yes stop_codon:yes gene_type:complete